MKAARVMLKGYLPFNPLCFTNSKTSSEIDRKRSTSQQDQIFFKSLSIKWIDDQAEPTVRKVSQNVSQNGQPVREEVYILTASIPLSQQPRWTSVAGCF